MRLVLYKRVRQRRCCTAKRDVYGFPLLVGSGQRVLSVQSSDGGVGVGVVGREKAMRGRFAFGVGSWGVVSFVGEFSLLLVSLLLFALSLESRRTGCMFLVVNSKVKVGRIVTARGCHKTGSGGANVAPLDVARFPFFKLSHACSLSGNVASSTTKKATLDITRGAMGKALKVSSAGAAPLVDVTRGTGTGKETINVAADIDVSRTAPKTFCTRMPSHGVCCTVNLRVTTSRFRFFTKTSFLIPASQSGRTIRLRQVLGSSNCTVLGKRRTFLRRNGGRSGLFLARLSKGKRGRLTQKQTSVPFTVSQASSSLALSRVAASTVRFLSTGGGNFFLVIRNNGVS